MPPVEVILYKEEDGTVPVIDWFDTLTQKARIKCMAWLGRLETFGHELQRPDADYLRDGIYELRVGLQGVNYRMLYFFHGTAAVVVSHGLVKERRVPPREIEKAVERKGKFEQDPLQHAFILENSL
jgi:phage-related protein